MKQIFTSISVKSANKMSESTLVVVISAEKTLQTNGGGGTNVCRPRGIRQCFAFLKG